MKITKILLISFIILINLGHNSMAEDSLASIISKAQNYMNSLKTAKARFIQTAWDGTQVTGTFYLSRPGKLRFEYDPPIKDFVVADGFFIYFYDSQMKEQTNAPIGQTLADFLLRKDLSFTDDKTISIEEVSKSSNLIKIKLVQTADKAAGSLTLGFTEEPFSLKKWRVVDAQGMITEIELYRLELGVNLDSNLFVYKNPDKPKFSYNE